MLMAFVRYWLEYLTHKCRFYSFVIHVWHPHFPLNGIKKYLNWLGNIKVVDLSFLCLQERVPTPSWGRLGPLQWLQAKPTSTLARMIRWWVCLLIVCHCVGQGVRWSVCWSVYSVVCVSRRHWLLSRCGSVMWNLKQDCWHSKTRSKHIQVSKERYLFVGWTGKRHSSTKNR